MPSRFRSLSEHALAALLALACAASASRAEDAGLIAGVFEPPRAAPELALRGSDGKELRLDRYRGKVVILGFGFSSCSPMRVAARTKKFQVPYAQTGWFQSRSVSKCVHW